MNECTKQKVKAKKKKKKNSIGKQINEKGRKILTPKQILQRLTLALGQVKSGNTSKNLQNEILQIIYSLYRPKEITEKVYNNMINSVKLQNKMHTMFMNSKNTKTYDPHRLLLNLSDKINLKKVINMLLYQIYAIHAKI